MNRRRLLPLATDYQPLIVVGKSALMELKKEGGDRYQRHTDGTAAERRLGNDIFN